MKRKMTPRERTYVRILLPILVLFFLFNTLPMIQGFIYSFTNYKGYGSYDWVGLRNYMDLFTDERVWHSYFFTFKYAICGTILVNVIALALAIGLNAKIRFKSALRGIYFIPNILGGLIIGYIFSFLFTYILPAVGQYFGISWLQNSILSSPDTAWIGVLILGGLIIGYIFSFLFTYILPAVGQYFGISWLQNSILSSPDTAWIGVLIVGVWQAVAMTTIIYISGLQTVPEDVYEASKIDGAGKWTELWVCGRLWP